MPRGRQYYDPIIQVPGKTDPQADYSRIELFPAGAESLGRLPQDQGKWIGRRINPDGSVAEEAPGDFDHDRALQQAEELWPGLTVYELNAENEDSTWDGAGPSPRIWQNVAVMSNYVAQHASSETEPDVPVDQDEIQLRVLPLVQPGNYALLDDIRALLDSWAATYEADKNPSAAMALRDAAEMLKDVG